MQNKCSCKYKLPMIFYKINPILKNNKNLKKMYENNLKNNLKLMGNNRQENFMRIFMKLINVNSMLINLCNFRIIYIKSIMNKCKRKRKNIKNIMGKINKYGQKKIKSTSQCGEPWG